jgi:hypothetical protein
MNENKKGVRANKRKVASLEPSKPRNFVAKNAINSGAGAHKDKKKAMKQGDTKHKKLDYAESLELRLNQKLKENKLDEFLPALVGAELGAELAGAAGAGRIATTAASLAGRGLGSAVSNALDNNDEQETDEEFNGEYDDEAGMAHGNLHTIARAAQGLIKEIEENDNLPEWCQEKIAKAEQMLVGVWDYILSQKEQGIDPKVSEGGYRHGFADPTAPRLGRRGRKDDEYPTPDPVEPQYNIKVNGEVINRQPFANRAEALAWAKQAVAAGKLDPKIAKLSPIQGMAEGSKKRCMKCGMIDCPCPGVDCKCEPIKGWIPNKGFRKAMEEAAVKEKWTQKYKSSINCSHPKGFSQKAHCAGKKKHNEDMSMEAVCPDCGMCEAHGNSKIYDKCWTGFRKVPGKKRGEDGSCKKIGEDVTEGAKVDRQAQHITKSMMKAHPGMSHDQAEAAAWAHIKHPKKKKKKVAEGIGYGSKVQHPKYGSGQVIKVYPNGMITVNFSGYPDPVSKKPGVQSNFMPGDASYNSLRMEGWTTDTLAAQLFEQEITYEDKLNSMLTKKLSK